MFTPPSTTWYSFADELDKNKKRKKKHQLILLRKQNIQLENYIQVQYNTYMQWAAVRTQQDDRRIPPHVCSN